MQGSHKINYVKIHIIDSLSKKSAEGQTFPYI